MSDIRVGLLGKLPPGDANGLQAVAAQAAKDPTRILVCIALVDCARLEENFDTDQHTARMRVRRIEVISGSEDAAVLQRLLMRSFERRTGATVLPYELEEDVEAAFGDLGPDQLSAESKPAQPSEPGEVGDAAGEHNGATEEYADELAAMKEDLAVPPTVCAICGTHLSYDPGGKRHIDDDGRTTGEDGHDHEPADD